MPEGRMRCRLRVAEPFTNEKVTLCCVTRFALHLITACGRSCLAAARVGLALDLPRRSIHYQAPASQPSKGKPRIVRGRTFNSPRSDAVGQPLPPGWTLSDIYAAGKMHNHRPEMNFKPSKTALALFKVLKIQFTICATHTKLCEMPKQGLLFRF